MIVWNDLTTTELAGLSRLLPVVVPIGLVESHGPHLQLGFDVYSAEYFARRVCDETGAILCPTLPYGFADSNREYTGTIGVRADTVAAVVADLCEMFCFHGFKKVIFLSGHGGNQMPVQLGFQRAWQVYPDLKPAYWSYFTVAGINLHHADEGETSIALATGAIVHLDRARDTTLAKPWHEVRSRYAVDPDSGGVNGHPSRATVESGEEMVKHITTVLTEKVRSAIDDGGQGEKV